MDLTFVAYGTGALFLYALVSRLLPKTPISGPMVFVVFGILGYAAGILDPVNVMDTGTKDVLEITLALLLFTDATNIHIRSWNADMELPTRLLAIGMPLTIIAGTVAAAVIFPALGLVGAAIVATILAPTDAALGQAVVTNPSVPMRIREALGIESGLNDGIALPIILFLISVQSAEEGRSLWNLFFEGIGIALVVGIAFGVGAGLGVRYASRRGWIAESWIQISVVAVAIGTFIVTDHAGGSGFIAAYVAGHAFGRIVERIDPSSSTLGEDLGTILTMVSFLIFGALILGPHPEIFTIQTVVFGVLSLTIIRMAAVAVAMTGAHMKPPTVVYLGWFGPRGLASIIFAGVLVEEAGLDDAAPIVAAVMVTVALSVLLHGMTAPWGAERYAAWANASDTSDAGR